MAKQSHETQSVKEQAVDEASTAKEIEPASTGIRARRAFMLRQLVPDGDYINKECVAKGKGTKVLLGRVYGIVTSTSRRQNTLPDGKVTESVALEGMFSSESYITGEIAQAATAYLPIAYSQQVETMFAADKELKTVEVDVDLGVEATGKTIPFEWMVIAHIEGEAMNVLKRLKASRARPSSLLLTAHKG